MKAGKSGKSARSGKSGKSIKSVRSMRMFDVVVIAVSRDKEGKLGPFFIMKYTAASSDLRFAISMAMKLDASVPFLHKVIMYNWTQVWFAKHYGVESPCN